MYDFINISSDATYSQRIKADVLEEYLTSVQKFSKESHLKFFKEIGGEKIKIMGIPADSHGNYGFNSLEGVIDINLIEIAVSWTLDDTFQEEISGIANAIAKQYYWIIEDDRMP